jgi:serine/threonine-protein kinase
VSFVPPASFRTIEMLGAGTTFNVAIVERGGARLLCKRLKPRMRDEPVAQAALEREAVLLDMVRHPSLPELVERGDDDHGPYLVESFVEAPSLRRVVEEHAAQGRALAPRVLRGVMRVGFQALAELHALTAVGDPLELVLGDIGPDHVLAADGQVFFVDFGQARYRRMPRTAAPGERGTLPYVAPEIARVESEPSQASDVYALAATFAYGALGRDPCRAETTAARLVEVCERGLDLDALTASESLDGASRTALCRALAFAAAERVTGAAAVLELLDA